MTVMLQLMEEANLCGQAQTEIINALSLSSLFIKFTNSNHANGFMLISDSQLVNNLKERIKKLLESRIDNLIKQIKNLQIHQNTTIVPNTVYPTESETNQILKAYVNLLNFLDRKYFNQYPWLTPNNEELKSFSLNKPDFMLDFFTGIDSTLAPDEVRQGIYKAIVKSDNDITTTLAQQKQLIDERAVQLTKVSRMGIINIRWSEYLNQYLVYKEFSNVETDSSFAPDSEEYVNALEQLAKTKNHIVASLESLNSAEANKIILNSEIITSPNRFARNIEGLKMGADLTNIILNIPRKSLIGKDIYANLRVCTAAYNQAMQALIKAKNSVDTYSNEGISERKPLEHLEQVLIQVDKSDQTKLKLDVDNLIQSYSDGVPASEFLNKLNQIFIKYQTRN
jgi:hypothetical protein